MFILFVFFFGFLFKKAFWKSKRVKTEKEINQNYISRSKMFINPKEKEMEFLSQQTKVLSSFVSKKQPKMEKPILDENNQKKITSTKPNQFHQQKSILEMFQSKQNIHHIEPQQKPEKHTAIMPSNSLNKQEEEDEIPYFKIIVPRNLQETKGYVRIIQPYSSPKLSLNSEMIGSVYLEMIWSKFMQKVPNLGSFDVILIHPPWPLNPYEWKQKPSLNDILPRQLVNILNYFSFLFFFFFLSKLFCDFKIGIFVITSFAFWISVYLD
jgi:hypothetical protein